MDKKSILQCIRDQRKALRLSQAGLGKTAGISREHYLRFERGDESISLRRFLRICGSLGLEVIVRPRSGRPTIDDLEQRYPKEDD